MLKQILKFHSSPHYYLNSSAKINSGELKPSEAQQPKPEVYTSIADLQTVSPREWDKKILVWSGKYKSKADIPPRISFDVLSKAQSKVRIKVCNYLIGITLLTCFVASILGKKRAQKGETISKLIMERDKKFVEEYKREQELKSKEVN